MRCGMCNFCPETDLGVPAGVSQMYWDKKEKMYLCDSCVTSVTKASFDFEEFTGMYDDADYDDVEGLEILENTHMGEDSDPD